MREKNDGLDAASKFNHIERYISGWQHAVVG